MSTKLYSRPFLTLQLVSLLSKWKVRSPSNRPCNALFFAILEILSCEPSVAALGLKLTQIRGTAVIICLSRLIKIHTEYGIR